MTLKTKTTSWLLAAFLCVTFIGCGQGRPARVPVSGQVLIDGKPLALGYVSFVSENNRPAGGKIGPDGRFTLSCFGDKDGCVPGDYVVTVVAAEPLNSFSQRRHAPLKYARPDTSGLKATVDGATDSLVFKLSWSGGRPFVERLDGGE